MLPFLIHPLDKRLFLTANNTRIGHKRLALEWQRIQGAQLVCYCAFSP